MIGKYADRHQIAAVPEHVGRRRKNMLCSVHGGIILSGQTICIKDKQFPPPPDECEPQDLRL